MQIFQKEQLNNRNKIEILDILIIAWTFSNALLKFFLYFFNIKSSSGQLAIVYIIVAIISILLCFRYFSRMIPSSFLAVVLLFATVGVSFVITFIQHGAFESEIVSEFKAYFAMALCTILITLIISWRKKNDINLNVVFILVSLLTLISFMSLFRGDSLTTGGYIRDSSGLIYQNVSYYSAHAFGLTLFHITETKKVKPLSWLYRIICFIYLIVQVSTCFLSGGRGGLVLLVILLISSILLYLGKKAYKIVVPAGIFIIIVRFTVPWLINTLNINIKGLTRILSFLNGNLIDDGRSSLYHKSFVLFQENPIIGNGIGSIFHYLDNYSHNMFLDILVETGIVGLIVFVVLLIAFIKKDVLLYRQGSLFRFLTIIFICGITLNMFSGYIWVNPHVWLPISVVLTIRKSVDDMNTSGITDSFASDTDNHNVISSLDGDNNG